MGSFSRIDCTGVYIDNDEVGKMSTTETERYVRITLLTFRGGLWISKEILAREVNKSAGSPDLDALLHSKKAQLKQKRNRHEITKGQYEALFPINKANTDVDEWDLSLLIKIVLFLFGHVLSGQETFELNEILRIRNEVVCHARQPSVQEQEYNTHWATLSMSLCGLAFDVRTRRHASDLVKELSGGPLDLQSSIEQVAQLCRNDEHMENVLASLAKLERRLNEVATGVVNANMKLDDVLAGVRELIRIHQEDEEGQCRVDIPMLNSSVCLSGKKEDVVKLAEEILLKVLRSAIDKVDDPNDDKTIRTAVQQFLVDLESKGGHAESADKGSIILKIRCHTLVDLESILRSFKRDGHRYRLMGIERALNKMLQEDLKVKLVLPKDTLDMIGAWLDEGPREYKRNIKLGIACDSADAVVDVTRYLQSRESADKLNQIALAVSDVIGDQIKIEVAPDVEGFSKALSKHRPSPSAVIDMGRSDVFCELYRKMNKQLSVSEEDKPDPNLRCRYCTRQERVVDFDDLRKGDHITMDGKNMMFNFSGRQGTFYKHHAIVKNVEKVNKNSGIATLIHFYSLSFDDAIQIRESDELLDLGKYELYKVRYCHNTHSPDVIIKRAESLINSEKSYGLMSCNCEHFCHWCCIGNSDSYQVHDMYDILRQIGTGALNVGGKIGKTIASILILSVEDIAAVGWKTACCIGVPWGILSVLAIAYLFYCCYRHHCLNKDKGRGLICARCCRQQKWDLWLRFFLYCTTQAGGIGLLSLILGAGASMGIVGGCIAAVSALSIALMAGIPKLKNALASPFRGQKVIVRTTKNIWVGDAISFKYKFRMHDGIVSKVDKLSKTKAKISVIHYSQPSMFGRRVVIEEERNIDLAKDVIKGHNYSGYDCHSPEIVVQRATQRLGETKYGVLSNRSDHFCFWAKVNEDVDDAPQECPRPAPQLKFDRSIKMGEDISEMKQINVDHLIDRKHATKTMDKVWARIPKDVKEGSVIQFKHGQPRHWHFAVTTEVEYPDDPSSLVDVTVVHYGKGSRPCEEKFHFDLRRDDVWIYKYHPIYRYSRDDVIRRARERVGHGQYNVLRLRSFQLAEDILVKDQDELVTKFDMVKPGDVIIFYYWSLKHAAVVIKVGKKTNKKKSMTRGVTIIHYALDGLFSTRTIKQETMQMDLSRDRVYRRVYEDVTYPPRRVISRAKSRLNERRFNMRSNTSWDLVHWAKVVQTPALVNKSFEDETCQTPGPGEKKMALLPLVGKARGRFQRVPVYAWRDLQPGIIIEYTYFWLQHVAILTDVNYKAKKITVIHYGTNTVFSTRTIMMDTFRVDLRKNQLWIYRCDPTVCNSPELSVALAYERLGEQKWGRKNKSWHFCRDCVLKKRSKSLERKCSTDT